MSELAKRTIFGGLFVIVVIGSILVDYWAFSAVLLVTVFIGSQEVSRLLNKEKNRDIEVMTVLMATLFFIWGIFWDKISFSQMNIMFVLLFVLLFIPFFVALFSKKHSFAKITLSCWTSMLYVALPCIILLELYQSGAWLMIKGKYLIIMIFALIWTNDIFAYLTGVTIGRHKLFERISPKKTIEGSLGGLVMTIVTAFLVNHFWYHFMSDWQMIGMAAVVVVFGSLGDLCESMLKRQAGVKDSGNVIPGHGGILDRFDATFMAVPFVYCYLILL